MYRILCGLAIAAGVTGCGNGLLPVLTGTGGFIAGSATSDGSDGQDGVNCWDLNGDRIDDPEEDTNGDGQWTAADCRGEAGADGIDCGVDGNDPDDPDDEPIAADTGSSDGGLDEGDDGPADAATGTLPPGLDDKDLPPGQGIHNPNANHGRGRPEKTAGVLTPDDARPVD